MATGTEKEAAIKGYFRRVRKGPVLNQRWTIKDLKDTGVISVFEGRTWGTGRIGRQHKCGAYI